MPDDKVQLLGLSQDELSALVVEMGEPAYRGRQIFASLHNRRLRTFDDMTDLSKEFRADWSARGHFNIRSRVSIRFRRRYASISDEDARQFPG